MIAFKHAKGGRRSRLPLEDMLLAALEYIREYRTYAHIAVSYQIDESNMYRIIRWVETALVKVDTFALLGRKALLKSDMQYEGVLIDATESSIERQKRGKNTTTAGRKNVTL